MKKLMTVEELVAIATNRGDEFSHEQRRQAVLDLILNPQSHGHPALTAFAEALFIEGGPLEFLPLETRIRLQYWLIKNLPWQMTTVEGGPLSSEGNGGAQ